jgi:hypothetical protein
VKWLVDVTVGVGDNSATFTLAVEADDPVGALGEAEDITREQMTIEAGHARPEED